jgi:hypothetical protein
LRPFLRLLTTVLGSIPLLMDPFFSGLAVVILFGLTFATFPVSDRDACVLRDLLQGPPLAEPNAARPGEHHTGLWRHDRDGKSIGGSKRDSLIAS